MSLGKLLVIRGEHDAARKQHETIYNTFTEGFRTRDLQDAKEILERLA